MIKETEKMGIAYLKAFGFSDEQVNPLVEIGIKDINNTLSKIEILLEETHPSIEELNNLLHALKGLLFQMGNTALGEKINEMRSHLSEDDILEIKELLFF